MIKFVHILGTVIAIKSNKFVNYNIIGNDPLKVTCTYYYLYLRSRKQNWVRWNPLPFSKSLSYVAGYFDFIIIILFYKQFYFDFSQRMSRKECAKDGQILMLFLRLQAFPKSESRGFDWIRKYFQVNFPAALNPRGHAACKRGIFRYASCRFKIRA